MPDVFISYSRRDKPFVQRLHQSLLDSQRDAWVDWEDIPATADWWQEIEEGIEKADTFIFIISPDSVRSDICRKELQHALDLNKRFIPLLYREIVEEDDKKHMHTAISSHNWLLFQDTNAYDTAFSGLLTTLDTDLGHVKEHTRLLLRAKEWKASEHPNTILLEGDEINKAEIWLAQAVSKKPTPTALHQEYIFASRHHATVRQRAFIGRILAALAVTVALAVVSFLLFLRAEAAEDEAKKSEQKAQAALEQSEINLREARNTQSLFLAAQSQRELETGSPQAALNLAIESLAYFDEGIYHSESFTALVSALRSPTRETLYLRHDGVLYDAVWNSDETTIITSTASIAGDDRKAFVWDTDGQQQATIEDIASIALLNPARTQFVTWTESGSVSLWDTQGQLINTLETGGYIYSGRWNADGTHFLLELEQGVVIWEITTGQTQTIDFGVVPLSVRWTNDESQVLVATNTEISRWDITTGERIGSYPIPDTTQTESLEFQEDTAQGAFSSGNLSWSPNDAWLLTFVNQTFFQIDLQTGEIVPTTSNEAVSGVTWNPDGEHYAVYTPTEIAIWHVDEQEPLAVFNPVEGEFIQSAKWDPKGEKLGFVQGYDLDIVSLETLEDIFYAHEFPVTGFTFAPNGNFVSWSSESFTSPSVISLWNEDGTYYPIRTKSYVINAVFNEGETHLLTTTLDGIAQVWDLQPEPALPGFIAPTFYNNINWNADETAVVAWNSDEAYVWDFRGQPLSSFAFEGSFPSFDPLSPDKTQLLTTRDTDVLVWNLQGEVLHTLTHETPIFNVWWTSDGKVLTQEDQRLTLWHGGEPQATLEIYTQWGMTPSADGTRILIYTEDPALFEVWDMLTGEKVQTLTHEVPVSNNLSSGFPVGKTTLTITDDSTIWVWQEGQAEPRQFDIEQSILGMRLSQDGSKILLWTFNQHVQVWTLEGALVWDIEVDSFFVNNAFWNPDESLIFVQTVDRGIQIRDMNENLLYTLSTADQQMSAFVSRDGKRVLTASYDSLINVWLLDIPELLRLANAVSTRQLTPQERAEFFLPPLE